MTSELRGHSGAENEWRNETDQRQCFSKSEAEQHVLANDTVGLGLTGNGLYALTEDDADADAGADRGETETD